MSKLTLNETLAVMIQSVIAADPSEGRIGHLEMVLEDSQGVERTLLLVLTERVPENSATGRGGGQ